MLGHNKSNLSAHKVLMTQSDFIVCMYTQIAHMSERPAWSILAYPSPSGKLAPPKGQLMQKAGSHMRRHGFVRHSWMIETGHSDMM